MFKHLICRFVLSKEIFGTIIERNSKNKKMKKIFAIAFMLLPLMGMTQQLKVKAKNVKVKFVAAMQNTEGTISGFEANFKFNMDDLAASSISGTVDVNTINTGNEKRDEHLKSKDYFEAETYPKMMFRSTSIEQDGETYVMTGILKIKGDEHEEKITFSYKDNMFTGQCIIELSNYKVGKFSEEEGEASRVTISFAIPVE